MGITGPVGFSFPKIILGEDRPAWRRLRVPRILCTSAVSTSPSSLSFNGGIMSDWDNRAVVHMTSTSVGSWVSGNRVSEVPSG